MKILIVKTSSMGDVLHALPAVSDAQAAVPDLVIDWAVEPAFADLVRLHPGIRKVWPTPIRRWRTEVLTAGPWRGVRDLRRALRAEAYDLVIDAQGLLKSALLARVAGARVAGFDRASARGGWVAALYAQRHEVPKDRHATDRVRLLMGAALGYTPALDRMGAALRSQETSEGTGGRQAFLIHGTTWPSKRWPLSQWIALAQGLLVRGYEPVATFADAAEESTARAIATAAPGVRLLERQTLVALAGTLAGSALVVGVDTGLTHLAAALGCPTIALFASTAPGLTAPRGPRVKVLSATTACAPCGKRRCPLVPDRQDPPCHATIGPVRVLAEIDGLAIAPVRDPEAALR